MSKKNNRQQKNNKRVLNQVAERNNQNMANERTTISKEDTELLEKAKKAISEEDTDFKTLKQAAIEKAVQEATDDYKLTLMQDEEDFKKSLDDKYEEALEKQRKLEEEITKLQLNREALKKEEADIDTKIHNTEQECEALIKKAQKEAKEENDKIIAQIETDKQNIETEKENIKQDRKVLEDEKLDFEEEKEDWIEEVNRTKNNLDRKKEIYENANPDKLDSLNTRINLLEEEIANWKKNYEKLSNEKNDLEIQHLKIDGYQLSDLERVNKEMETELEKIKDKYSAYDDFKLQEMEAAYDNKANLEEKIQSLTSEIASINLELSRRENVQLEYQQLKEQLGLLRTLNDHLRTELSNTKKMLESSTGDICPSLTYIDTCVNSLEEKEHYENRRSKSQSYSLHQIVQHVKQYAASRENPLFYSDDDLAAFIAGLSASPLSILQGMSGTGKTSLPRIFSEAIMAELNVIPVASSWRDRNELLGYYNDFSKKYTAKEFTCALYKANTKNYDDVPYFIVLDEMNLSRIEYYFNDFLSVLELDKKDWKIQLVETDMRQLPNELTDEVIQALNEDDDDRTKEMLNIVNKLYSKNTLDQYVINPEEAENLQGGDKQKLLHYLAENQFQNAHKTSSLVTGPELLENGKIIRIPENVWFIGTANKDESTFEITDKVYDRAQVLNFLKRGEGEVIKSKIPPIFVPYKSIKFLFHKAQTTDDYKFNCATNEVTKKIDDILIKEFKISFGNRIQDQINKFVPTFLAASFDKKPNTNEKQEYINKALDYQITNKVLRKLEYVDMTGEQIEQLSEVFISNNLVKAQEFLESKRD